MKHNLFYFIADIFEGTCSMAVYLKRVYVLKQKNIVGVMYPFP